MKEVFRYESFLYSHKWSCLLYCFTMAQHTGMTLFAQSKYYRNRLAVLIYLVPQWFIHVISGVVGTNWSPRQKSYKWSNIKWASTFIVKSKYIKVVSFEILTKMRGWPPYNNFLYSKKFSYRNNYTGRYQRPLNLLACTDSCTNTKKGGWGGGGGEGEGQGWGGASSSSY